MQAQERTPLGHGACFGTILLGLLLAEGIALLAGATRGLDAVDAAPTMAGLGPEEAHYRLRVMGAAAVAVSSFRHLGLSIEIGINAAISGCVLPIERNTPQHDKPVLQENDNLFCEI